MNNPYSENIITEIMPQKLKELRKNKGLTIEDVGKFVNKTKAAVSTWENGKALPDINTLIKLCKLYNIADFNEFMEWNVPTSYPNLTKKERKIITLFRESSKKTQKSIENILEECNKS